MVGIVFLLDIEYAPYIDKYIDILNEEKKEFEVIYWNRSNKKDNECCFKAHIYNKKSNLNKSKFSKIGDFLGYRKFVVKTINERKYDKLIILTTLTGILLSDILIKNYQGKYIFDIRDYSFEKNKIFYLLEKKIISQSFITTISSNGFKEFLPKTFNYVISHNIIRREIEEAKDSVYKIYNKNEKICLQRDKK